MSPDRTMYSIRNRLSLLLVCGIGLLLLGTGAVLQTVISTQLLRTFDDILLARAQSVIALTEQEAGIVAIDEAVENMAVFNASARPEYFALWRASGGLIAKSRSLGDETLPSLSELQGQPVFEDITLRNGLRGRLVRLAFVPQIDTNEDAQGQAAVAGETPPVEALDPTVYPDRAVVLSVAKDRQHLDTLDTHIGLALAAVCAGVLVGLVGLVRLLLRIGLRPLVDVQRQMSQLDANSLQTGLRVNTQTYELAPVVEQLNRLLRRLDAAFIQERQFSSAVAHELRTPLAELRTLTEVNMRWPCNRQSVQQYFKDAHEICLQMERLVVTLLTLRSYESGTQWIHHREVNLFELVDACWQTVQHSADEKMLRFQCDLSPTSIVSTDRDMLTMVLSNLLNNAVMYSPPHGEVRCAATSRRGVLCLTISNIAVNLIADDLPHLFERFWRKDPARSDQCHLGLGLAIVKACSDLLDLQVQAELGSQQLLSISLSLGTPQPSGDLEPAGQLPHRTQFGEC